MASEARHRFGLVLNQAQAPSPLRSDGALEIVELSRGGRLASMEMIICKVSPPFTFYSRK